MTFTIPRSDKLDEECKRRSTWLDRLHVYLYQRMDTTDWKGWKGITAGYCYLAVWAVWLIREHWRQYRGKPNYLDEIRR